MLYVVIIIIILGNVETRYRLKRVLFYDHWEIMQLV